MTHLYAITSDDGAYREANTRDEAHEILESLREQGRTGVEISRVK